MEKYYSQGHVKVSFTEKLLDQAKVVSQLANSQQQLTVQCISVPNSKFYKNEFTWNMTFYNYTHYDWNGNVTDKNEMTEI